MNASTNARVRSHLLSPVAMVYQYKQSHMKYWWTHVYLIDSSVSLPLSCSLKLKYVLI